MAASTKWQALAAAHDLSATLRAASCAADALLERIEAMPDDDAAVVTEEEAEARALASWGIPKFITSTERASS